MGAPLHTTFGDLTRTLVKFTAAACVDDLHAWNDAKCPRPYRGLRTALNHYCIGPDASEPLSIVKARCIREIGRQRLARDQGHWTFDPIKVSALVSVHQAIEQFEREAA